MQSFGGSCAVGTVVQSCGSKSGRPVDINVSKDIRVKQIVVCAGANSRLIRYLRVTANEESPLARVDLEVREGINLDLLLGRIPMRICSE